MHMSKGSIDAGKKKTQKSTTVWKGSSNYCLSLLLGWRICLGEWNEEGSLTFIIFLYCLKFSVQGILVFIVNFKML